jgi:hypothetical protein
VIMLNRPLRLGICASFVACRCFMSDFKVAQQRAPECLIIVAQYEP